MIRFIFTVFTILISSTVFATTFNLNDENTRIVGHNLIVFSHEQDTLLDIARQFDIGYSEIVNANPNLDPWVPGNNKRVIVPNKFILPDALQTGIVINIAEMRLYYYPKSQKGQVQQVITHPIGIGREGWRTPLGKTTIIAKKKDPTWTPPASIIAEHLEKGDPLPNFVPAGPDNPLGQHAMRLGMPGYLLHGTNRPFGVGLRVSHGCIRLFPEDIEHLFNIVPVSTPVHILYQPYKAALEGGELYLEAHKVQYDVDSRQGNNMTPMVAEILKLQNKKLTDDEWPFAETFVRQQNGIVQALKQTKQTVLEKVWFLHAGTSKQARKSFAKALVTLSLNDHFWPLKVGSEGETLIGPFNERKKADQVGLEIRQLANISVWTVLISNDTI